MRRTPATIVVLEENAAAQELIDQALRKSGDRVLISNSAVEALGLTSRVRIDLIVGDVGLLEKSDPDVVEKLQSVGQVLYTNVRGSRGSPSWTVAQRCAAPSLWRSSERPSRPHFAIIVEREPGFEPGRGRSRPR